MARVFDSSRDSHRPVVGNHHRRLSGLSGRNREGRRHEMDLTITKPGKLGEARATPARVVGSAAVALALSAMPALAQQTTATPTLDSGDTAWMLTSTVLVLMMTIPGLALFYGGMVRKKNVLATVMQSFAACCLMSVLWMIIGYSIAFGDGGALNAYSGGLNKIFLGHLTKDGLQGTIPESVFMTFQMTFAIITPALICGAVADRMKFLEPFWCSFRCGSSSSTRPSVTGFGRRLSRLRWRAGFRRRNGRAHQLRDSRSRLRTRTGPAPGLWPGEYGPP